VCLPIQKEQRNLGGTGKIMPPIFGILNTKLQQPDPEMICRMKEQVQYIKPRRLETLEVKGGFMAAAVVVENPLVEGRIRWRGRPWVAVGDVSLYKREEVLKKTERIRTERLRD